MSDNNVHKKKQIENIVSRYNERMRTLKKERDKYISDFLRSLESKKIDKLRNELGKHE